MSKMLQIDRQLRIKDPPVAFVFEFRIGSCKAYGYKHLRVVATNLYLGKDGLTL